MTMFATLVGPAGSEPLEPGRLALVEVPPNCTVHDADAQRLGRILGIAKAISDEWSERKSVAPALLDELAQWAGEARHDRQERHRFA